MLKLVDVYDCDEQFVATTLYDLLQERDPKANISHRELPSFENHVKFIRSGPYLDWWLLEANKEVVGSMYLTDRNEIGLFIFKAYQGKGFGTKALALLREEHEGPFLANISPANGPSQDFFYRNGFELVQYTFKEKE